MNEMVNDRERPNQYCSGCLRTRTLTADGEYIDGTARRIHRTSGLPRSAPADRAKEKTTRRLIQWGIVACSFIGLVGVFLSTMTGG